MSFKPVILPGKTSKDEKTNIKIRITHRGKVRELPTQFYLEPCFFDMKSFKVDKKHPQHNYIDLELKKIILSYEQKILGIDTSAWDISELLRFIKRKETPQAVNFFEYFQTVIDSKKNRTAELYQQTLKKIQAFRKINFLSFSEIDKTFLERFDEYLLSKGCSINTRSIEMRNLRHVFNEAINDELTTNYPFRKFKIKSKTESDVIPLTTEQLKSVRDYKTDIPHLKIARDAFMISFYLIGINISDVYDLEKSRNGRVRYIRHKTSTNYDIQIQPELKELIGEYSDEKRMFNFYKRYTSVESFRGQINKHLKVIGEAIGVPELIMYHARHTWSNHAADLDIPKETISASLGHGIKTVTDIYIKFERKKIDAANRQILDLFQ